MTKPLTIILLLIFLPLLTYSQEVRGIRKGPSLGFHLAQYQDDFGLGLNATSPYLFKTFAFRLKGNLMWHSFMDGNESTWSDYNNLSLGITSIAGDIGTFLRLYGEGGFIMLFPNSAFSSEDIETGGYGLFGFEFFMAEDASYFIELGGIGTGARADKEFSNPIYSNGLMINVGFRYSFKG